MIKVLIVDDSSFARRSLSAILEKDKDIKVVAVARDGVEGIEMARRHDPDVITMDVEMPRMDGLAALQHIMAENPLPVIMVSSLTQEGADTALRALDLGALDYTPKLGSHAAGMALSNVDLCAKIKTLARRKAFMRLVFNRQKQSQAKDGPLRSGAAPAPASSVNHAAPSAVRFQHAGRPSYEIVSIGVSTGGPPAVQKVLSALPANFPVPILIAQHMPSAFTGPFAKRLDAQCAISVKEADPLERLKGGTAYVCPGGKHLRLENRGGALTGVVTDEPKEALYKPSANVLMDTTGTALGRKALGVILTGMGSDGLEGVKVLKEKGGWAIAQSEASCVVYGMPKAIVDANLADEIVDLDDMAGAILAHFSR